MDFKLKYRGTEVNIRDFNSQHPGGMRLLNKFEGLEIEENFLKYEHSKLAEYLLMDFMTQQNEKSESLEVIA